MKKKENISFILYIYIYNTIKSTINQIPFV